MKTSFTHPRWAGLLLAAGAVQFLLALVVSESLYPNYSVADNFISDLGVGPVAGIFNGSVFALGVAVLGAAYLLWRASGDLILPPAVALAGLGAIGVGIFPEGTGPHFAVSAITFFFGGVAALLTYRLKVGRLEAALSALLGLIGLAALGLFGSGNYLGLGPGGMERMIAYPILLWATAAGGYLFAQAKE
jgi:hypothetical membrane protein